MEEKQHILNEFLVRLFNNILKIEEQALSKSAFKDLTLNDLHTIEAIGYDTAKNMSETAKKLDITVGTLTIAINGLVKKGYVKRVRSVEDRRVVLISLTEKGQKAFLHHEGFHKQMIQGITDQLSVEQYDVLVESLSVISKFFNDQYLNK